jgi:hypothetical protein
MDILFIIIAITIFIIIAISLFDGNQKDKNVWELKKYGILIYFKFPNDYRKELERYKYIGCSVLPPPPVRMDDGIEFTQKQQIQWDENYIKLLEIYYEFTGKDYGIERCKKALEYDKKL